MTLARLDAALYMKGGKISDMRLADELNLSVHQVRKRRIELGIGAYKGRGVDPQPPPNGVDWDLPNSVLTDRLQVSASTLARWRREVGKARKRGEQCH